MTHIVVIQPDTDIKLGIPSNDRICKEEVINIERVSETFYTYTLFFMLVLEILVNCFLIYIANEYNVQFHLFMTGIIINLSLACSILFKDEKFTIIFASCKMTLMCITCGISIYQHWMLLFMYSLICSTIQLRILSEIFSSFASSNID